MASPDAEPPVPRAGRLRRIFLLVAINAAGLAVLLGAAELVVRAKVEGGLGAAWRSLGGERAPLASEGESDWLEPHPVLGYRLNTAHEPVNDAGIRHGELGPTGATRVLVLGDSVSWESDGWVTMLEARLRDARGEPELEVVNAAIPGYTTHQERLLFETELADAEPELVVLQYCLNDNHQFLHELTDDGRWLVRRDARQVLVPTGSGVIDVLTRRSYLVFELRKRAYLERERSGGFYPWDVNPDFAPAWQDASWLEQEEELRRLRDLAREAGARFAIVVVPYGSQLGEKYLARDRDYVLRPQRILGELCERLEVPLLDVYDAFHERRDEALYKPGDPVHLTPTGHRLLAGRVAAFVGREGLLP